MVYKSSLEDLKSIKTKRKGVRGSSNPGSSPDDVSQPRRDRWHDRPAITQAGAATTDSISQNNKLQFKKGIEDKKVRIALAIMEDEYGFSNLNLRERIAEAARRGDLKFQEWYYNHRIEGTLPDTWERFTEMVREYCAEETLENQRKYIDESWVGYLTRLIEWAGIRRIPEKEILKKLRKEDAPRELSILFLTTELNMKELKSRVEEWEGCPRRYKSYHKGKLDKTRRIEKREFINEKKIEKDIRDIICYQCKEKGHYARDCPNKKLQNRMINIIRDPSKEEENDVMDIEEVQINGVRKEVLFDTGATDNVVTKEALKKIPGVSTNKLEEPVIFKLINDTEIVAKEEVRLEVKYKDKFLIENFKCIDAKNEMIILGNRLVKELRGFREEKIPIECTINTCGRGPISWTRPIRSRADMIEFQELVNELEKNGVIEESRSLWLNPVVLVRKSSGKLRFCADFRRLNDLVDQDGYELPRIQEIISSLNGNKWFSVLDLKDGFFQINLRLEDREKTAFYTGKRLMQFVKMPQGYKNSPSVFQRAMYFILGDLLGSVCLAYIDDILVFGKTIQEHDSRLEMVLIKLQKYGLKENVDKRVFRKKEVKFLGFNISENRVKPTHERAQGIVQYSSPKSKKDLRRFWA